MDFLDYAFMQRALLAAVLVGITAPAVGIYLVQRRQALMGDGIGHVAMTGSDSASSSPPPRCGWRLPSPSSARS